MKQSTTTTTTIAATTTRTWRCYKQAPTHSNNNKKSSLVSQLVMPLSPSSPPLSLSFSTPFSLFFSLTHCPKKHNDNVAWKMSLLTCQLNDFFFGQETKMKWKRAFKMFFTSFVYPIPYIYIWVSPCVCVCV